MIAETKGRYRAAETSALGYIMIGISVLVAMVFATGAAMTYRLQGWNWVSLGLAGMTVLSLAGILEALIVRVQLTDEALLMTDLRGRRSYPLKDITGVGEGKGVPTAIFLGGRTSGEATSRRQ